MNERPGVDRLREAMHAAEDETHSGPRWAHAPDPGAGLEAAVSVAIFAERVDTASAAAAAEREAQRQRDLDAALADAIEVVGRHRARLGRRVCSRHDGETVRRVFEQLRALMGTESGADADPSFL